VCVCVCLCVRERERESEIGRQEGRGAENVTLSKNERERVRRSEW
jgi:hypothetical protein